MLKLIVSIGILVSLVEFGDAQVGFGGGSSVPGACVCATLGSCSLAGGGGSNDGTGQLDARILNTGSTSAPVGSTDNTGIGVIGTGIGLVAWTQGTCDSPSGLERCCPTNGYTCGIRYPPLQGSPTPSAGQASFGAYPFQAAILTSSNIYLGSGVAIDQFHVLTAAHKINNVSVGATLKARMGDWDLSATSEPIPFMEFTVLNVTIHPNFTAGSLKNNIAILTLLTPIPLGQYPTMSNICLPNTTINQNIRCMVAGWGKNDPSTGVYQSILKEVDIPLVPFAQCQDWLRATRLGPNFALDPASFLCAGGEAGKDSCIGDGGAPLSCFIYDRYYLVGLTAWGIGCGMNNVPGVYVNIQTYVPWLQGFIAAENRMANKSATTTAPITTTKKMSGGLITTPAPEATSNEVAMTQSAAAQSANVSTTPSTTKGVASNAPTPSPTFAPIAQNSSTTVAIATFAGSTESTKVPASGATGNLTTISSNTGVTSQSSAATSVKGSIVTTAKGGVNTVKRAVKAATTIKPTVKGSRVARA